VNANGRLARDAGVEEHAAPGRVVFATVEPERNHRATRRVLQARGDGVAEPVLRPEADAPVRSANDPESVVIARGERRDRFPHARLQAESQEIHPGLSGDHENGRIAVALADGNGIAELELDIRGTGDRPRRIA